MATKRFCDGNCNKCVLMKNNDSNRQLTMILNKLLDKFGDEVYKIVQEHCPNLTCCADCHIDDFCHIKGCELID